MGTKMIRVNILHCFDHQGTKQLANNQQDLVKLKDRNGKPLERPCLLSWHIDGAMKWLQSQPHWLTSRKPSFHRVASRIYEKKHATHRKPSRIYQETAVGRIEIMITGITTARCPWGDTKYTLGWSLAGD